MRVFKNYFKIAKAHKVAIILYTVIFIAIMSFSTKSDDTNNIYTNVRPDIYVKDEANTDLSRGLYSYLEKKAVIKEMDESVVEDKLFYQMISASLVIEKDFDKSKNVNFKAAPNDMYGMTIKELVNQYLSQVNAYKIAGFKDKDAIKYTNEDLEKRVDVEIKSGSKIGREDNSIFYFNFINYLILSQVLLIVTGFVVWALYILMFVVLYKYDFSLAHTNLMMVNSFFFTISVVTKAVLISSLVKNQNAIQGIMQIVSLGSSFLCGAFVPQDLLSKTALTLGKIFPSYYYIKNNEMLIENPNISTILPNIGIMLAFSLVFVLISMGMKTKVNDKIS